MGASATPASSSSASPEGTSKQMKLLVAGGGAGTIAKTVVAPLERIRILYQTGNATGKFWGNVRLVTQTEGVVGLWRGNWVNCLRVFPSRGILFSMNHKYKHMFATYWYTEHSDSAGQPTAKSMHNLPIWMSFTSGSLAGLTATAITYPLDVVRTRLAGELAATVVGTTKVASHPSIFTILYRMVANEGFRSWYRGMGPTILGALPYEGIKFATFDWMKSRRPSYLDESPVMDVMYKLSSGALAGAASGAILYPNDTVRRLMQMQGHNGRPVLYRNTVECWKHTYKHGGVQRFYHGVMPYMARIMPNSAITFGSFELAKHLLDL